ncbi:MAG: hypothetical protein IJS60_10020, partial [Abditibacteriota bacterium]|nr:hypothetical protein [Abditibacteriota bacterium]
WNTLTTPMPQGVYMYNQTHNGEHKLRYEQSIGALPKLNYDQIVNLNNLTISTDSDILVWKGLDETNNNLPIETPTINLTVSDNDTTDPYNVTVTIYHTGAEYSGTTNYNGQSQWTPVKTITLTNQTGATQTITWDGSLDSGVASQNALSHANWTDQYEELVEANNGNPIGVTVPTPTIAEPWTYTYDITVTQTDTETYTFPDQQNGVTWSASDNTWLRSKFLTISRAKDSNNKYIYDLEFKEYNDNGTTRENAQIDPITGEPDDWTLDDEYIYYIRSFALKDTYSEPAKAGYLLMYNDIFEMSTVSGSLSENCLIHNSSDLKTSGASGLSHKFEVEIPRNNMQYAGNYIFPMILQDNHQNKYRNHTQKKVVSLNSSTLRTPVFFHKYVEAPNIYGMYYSPGYLAERNYDLITADSRYSLNGYRKSGEPIVLTNDPHCGQSGLMQNLNAYEALHTLNTYCPICAQANPNNSYSVCQNKIWAFYGHGDRIIESNSSVSGAIVFYNGVDNYVYLKGDSGNTAKILNYNRQPIATVEIGDLSYTDFGYFFGCKTAEGNNSIAEKFQKDYKMKATLGFVYLTMDNGPFEIFDETFWNSILVGNDINTSNKIAKEKALPLFIEKHLVYVGNGVLVDVIGFETKVFGDGSIKLF